MASITEAMKLLKNKDNYLKTKELWLTRQVDKMQDGLLRLILTDYLPQFTFDKDGNIARNAKNAALINKIDDIFAEFNKNLQSDVLKKFGEDLMRITPFNEKYYKGIGIKKGVVDNLVEKLGFVQESIGITNKGNLAKGGYLDRLSRVPEVRQAITEFFTNSTATTRSLKEMTQGLKDLIVGNKDVDGRLQRYYRQFAYDTFSQVDETQNKYMADQLGLNAFIYVGTEITSTRPFCGGGKDKTCGCTWKDKIGKVWTRKEAEKWNKRKWKGKSGDFFIHRGGYNCRHRIGWISDSLAIKRRPELSKEL